MVIALTHGYWSQVNKEIHNKRTEELDRLKKT